MLKEMEEDRNKIEEFWRIPKTAREILNDEAEVVLTEEPPKPPGKLKKGEKGPNGKRYKVKKNVLDAWKKERARVVKENNAIIRKGQVEDYHEKNKINPKCYK